jgi:hypothetical protein
VGRPGLGLATEATSEAPDFNAPLIRAPEDPTRWPAFRRSLDDWRTTTRGKLGYDDALYQREDFAWVPSCFSCCFLMVCDERFLDRHKGAYNVESFLDAGGEEFGGYDAVVLWHAYPRIGLDDRNQFDFYRDLPDGLEGLRGVTRRFHARGVRVFVDYNPWDTGTRREGEDDIDALVELVRDVEADGIFLDTMDRGAEGFRAKLDAARPGVVLESELALPVDRVADHHLSWAQWFRDGPVPGVLRNKWLERRHMQHQIQRWSHDHSGELQSAWMNGSGMMVWENVFGSWVGWSRRDRSILRALLPIQRRYGRLFSGERWKPLVPTLAKDVYASLWEGEDGVRLWTLVNRSELAVEGPLLRAPSSSGHRYLDLVKGRDAKTRVDGESVALEGRLEPRGLGSFLSGARESLGPDVDTFLAGQRAIAAQASPDATSPTLQKRRVPVAPTPTVPGASLPRGMVLLPAATLRMRTTFRVRECGFYGDHGAHLPGGGFRGFHREDAFEREVSIRTIAIDRTPVTNAEFAVFLRESGYRPRHTLDTRRASFGTGRAPTIHRQAWRSTPWCTWTSTMRAPTHGGQESASRRRRSGSTRRRARTGDGGPGVTSTALSSATVRARERPR